MRGAAAPRAKRSAIFANRNPKPAHSINLFSATNVVALVFVSVLAPAPASVSAPTGVQPCAAALDRAIRMRPQFDMSVSVPVPVPEPEPFYLENNVKARALARVRAAAVATAARPRNTRVLLIEINLIKTLRREFGVAQLLFALF